MNMTTLTQPLLKTKTRSLESKGLALDSLRETSVENHVINTPGSDFKQALANDFNHFMNGQSQRFNANQCLTIDFHCHDHNSDIPDELWGRILRLPETWLKTDKLFKRLKKNGCDVFTVTNHNNARSCWEMLDKGEDVLVGSEFTCFFPEYNLFVHVLTYGFTPEQEVVLNQKRRNIYDFVRYAAEQDIPLILPHPLYFYTRNEHIDPKLFEKLALMFSRFEVLNGQRDLWQNTLTLNWVKGLDEEKMLQYEKAQGMKAADFGVDICQEKICTGGSDDHTGILAGSCGSRLYIPDLAERLKTEKRSDLALEAIKAGNIAPFGHVGDHQKLSIALLDYISQVATKVKDPGMLRIFLHQGSTFDKLGCFVLSNFFLELQKHKNTMRFFDLVHDAFQGKKPGKMIKWSIKKDYKFCLGHLEQIATSQKQGDKEFVKTVDNALSDLFLQLNQLVVKRIKKQLDKRITKHDKKPLTSLTTEAITQKFEIPSQLTAIFMGDGKRQSNLSNIRAEQFLDQLTFPLLIGTIIASSVFASTRLLHSNREFLNSFARTIGKHEHPKRALYLTDTLRDKNGVSNSLSGKLREIQAADLPVDFLICHPDAEPESHLHVVKPIAEFSVPQYEHQTLRMPDLMEVARIFQQGGYDRIVCSTEGPMALASLFIQSMFNVPGYFFMHTDWIDFLRHSTDLDQHGLDRIRRLMRALYKRYQGIFVLNSEHKAWLTGHEMSLDEDKVFLTAHHTQPRMQGIAPIKKSDLFEDATDETPVLFLACRISKEKGLLDLPKIVNKAREQVPNLRIVIAGEGPAEAEIKQLLPDALMLGWQSKEQLAALYQGLDLFIFPSRFDTFGNVILEAFVNGMPVVAFDCKGPKDIINHGINGYLVESNDEMAAAVVDYFNKQNPSKSSPMQSNALVRAAQYQAKPIMHEFLTNMGLELSADYYPQATQPHLDEPQLPENKLPENKMPEHKLPEYNLAEPNLVEQSLNSSQVSKTQASEQLTKPKETVDVL